MPLTDDMHLISVDDHLVEPPQLWLDRLPEKYRDAGPRIIDVPVERNPDGPPANVWQYEGKRFPQIGLNAVAGKDPKDYGTEPMRYTDMIPGCYEPHARVIDMDLDGVQAALCFPSFPRFAGTVFLQAEDKSLALLCMQAWNDFMIDEWCGAAPDRFIPVVIMPLWDVDACVAELRRTVAKGARAVSFSENPAALGLPSFYTAHWDPFLSACEDADVPLCLHFGSSGQSPQTAPEAPFAVTITLFGCNSMYSTADLLFSPVFHRHPRLKIAMTEGGIGWLPYLLERADYVWNRHRSTRTSINAHLHQSCSPSTCLAASSTTCTASVPATRSAFRASCGKRTTRTRTPTGPTVASVPSRSSPTSRMSRLDRWSRPTAVSCSTFRADVRPMSSDPTRWAEGIDPNASDWSDLDLLTRAEARERLLAEVGVAERDVAQEEATRDGTRLVALRRRLALLQERLES
jgi:predicted TIM-barrel fold metal-dependent hydrolase